jgi:hypothetical protein
MGIMALPNESTSSLRRMNADDLYWEEVEEARNRSFEDKLLAGPRLFDLCCEFARSGIRMQNPELDDDGVDQELERRLLISRRLEEQA